MKKVYLVLLLTASLCVPAFPQTKTTSKRADAYFHFGKARLLAEQGQLTEAINEYNQALELDPGNSLIYSEMAETYMGARRIREAVDAAEKAVNADPDNIDAHKVLASIYTGMIGDPNATQPVSEETVDKAIHEFEEIARIDPSDRQSYLMLGRLYQVKNDDKKAEEIYKKFLGLEPGSEDGITALAKLYLDAGDGKAATELLENFIKDHPEADQALDTLAQAYLDSEQYDKAADTYRKVLTMDPDNVDVKKSLAQALFMKAENLEGPEKNKQYDEAADLYLDLLKADSNDGMALLRLGQIYREEKRYAQAHIYMQKAIQLFPDSMEVQFNMMLLERDEGMLDEAISRVGDMLKRTERANGRYSDSEKQNRRVFLSNEALMNDALGRYDDEIKSFTALKAISPDDDGRIDFSIISAYRSAKSLDKALAYCEDALKQNPDNRRLKMVHADMIAEKGKVEDGIRALQQLTDGSDADLEVMSTMVNVYERAKKLDDAHKVAESIVKRFPNQEQSYFIQGSILDKEKKFNEAEQSFRKALDIEQDNPVVLNYLGYMLADRGVKLDEAVSMIEKAVDQDPTNGAYLDSLGWAYFRQNKLDLAEEYLKKALKFAGTDPTVNDHMGDLYFKTQRFEEAKASWTKSVQLSNDPEEIAKVKKKIDDLKGKLAKNQKER